MSKKFGLVALCLIVTLVGCGEKTMDTVTEPPTDPVHFYEEVREDFLIDAEVIGFPGDHSLTVYEATPRVITEGQILNFLTANGDPLMEWVPVSSSARWTGYQGKTAKNGTFKTSLSTSGLYPGNFNYDNELDTRWGNCLIYPGQWYYDENADQCFAHLFMEPKDFAFATAKDAEEEVRKRLSLLGLEDLILHRTLYIDHQIIAEELTPILRTEEGQSLDVKSYIPTYDDWSPADDGYIFEYFLGINQVPMFYSNVTTDTLIYQGDTIRVWYQQSGIVSLSANAVLWSIGNAVKETTGISAEEALSIARGKLENDLLSTSTVINTISGEYIYTPMDNRFLLRPVWVVSATSTDKYSPSVVTKYVVIDAISGEELM